MRSIYIFTFLAAISLTGCIGSGQSSSALRGWSDVRVTSTSPPVPKAPETTAICHVQAPRIPTPSDFQQVLKRPRRPIEAAEAPRLVAVDVPAQLRSLPDEPIPAPIWISLPRLQGPITPGPRFIPAEYAEVSTDSEPSLVWLEQVCDSWVAGPIAESLQRALAENGLFTGTVDGDYTEELHVAIETFKRGHNLYGEGVTFELLAELGLPTPDLSETTTASR